MGGVTAPCTPSSKIAHILALNCGSSSLKFGLHRITETGVDRLVDGEVQAIGTPTGTFDVRAGAGEEAVSRSMPFVDHAQAFAAVADCLSQADVPQPTAVGHRVVHGGPRLRRHCLIDAAVLDQLQVASAFAPLHNPSALAVIHSALECYAGLPQVACFDTAFHAGMPDEASSLPLPASLREEGVRRYGFHGLSCESIVNQLVGPLPDRMIVAHLGNGASVTAIERGTSADTSMGLTPTGGVIMGTRSGDLDPGVLLFLMREKKLDGEQLSDLVDHHSGLLGISGLSADMRVLHARSSTQADAGLAIRMFARSVAKQIAGMITVLDGLDLLVFTGGIGEHDAIVRDMICDRLRWAGIVLDPVRNAGVEYPISASSSQTRVIVLPSDEDGRIVRHTHDLTRAA